MPVALTERATELAPSAKVPYEVNNRAIGLSVPGGKAESLAGPSDTLPLAGQSTAGRVTCDSRHGIGPVDRIPAFCIPHDQDDAEGNPKQ